MAEYRIIEDDYGECRSCANCGYPAALGEFEIGSPRTKTMLCQVCASTYLSSATVYPEQCPDVKLHKSIGWIANHILDAIAKAGGK